MKIAEIMELGKLYNFEGTYSNGKDYYKFINGRMSTFNKKQGKWVRPSITSYWVYHVFTVSYLTKRK